MDAPEYYRKKPIPLEVWQVTVVNLAAVAQWCGGEAVPYAPGGPHVVVHSLDGEGDRRAQVGDWVIKGTRAEFWRVERQIFAETYEPVLD